MKLEFALPPPAKKKEDEPEEQPPPYNLKVFVIKGEFSDDVDLQKGEGKMDPFARLVLGSQKYQTAVAQDQGIKPVWNQQFGFEWKKSVDDTLLVEIWDKDKQSAPPDFLGSGNVTISELWKKNRLE